MFLVDKLPKESVETTEETLGIYNHNHQFVELKAKFIH